MFKFEIGQVFERIETRLVLEEIQVVLHHFYIVIDLSDSSAHCDGIDLMTKQLLKGRSILEHHYRSIVYRISDYKRVPCRLIPQHEHQKYEILFEYQMSRLLCE
jgi:hypothetical protein